MGTATATGPTAVASPPTAEVRESEDPPAVRGEDNQLKVSPDGEIAIAPRELRLITFGKVGSRVGTTSPPYRYRVTEVRHLFGTATMIRSIHLAELRR